MAFQQYPEFILPNHRRAGKRLGGGSEVAGFGGFEEGVKSDIGDGLLIAESAVIGRPRLDVKI